MYIKSLQATSLLSTKTKERT